MRSSILFLLIITAFALPLHSQYRPLSPTDQSLLYKDSPDWIKARAKYFFSQRAYPLGYIPDGAREQALRDARAMTAWRPPASLQKSKTKVATTWKLIGPVNRGGRVTGLAIDPAQPDVVFMTAADGGVWKSTDFGGKFIPVADDLATMAMGSVTVDPSNSNIVYVGTGEANFSADSYPGIGMVKSTDGGNTWQQAGPKISGNIAHVAVHPVNGQIVLAATKSGLFRSSNGGNTWTKVIAGNTNDVDFHPVDPSIVFGCVAGKGVYRSTDAGVTWTQLNNGIPTTKIRRLELDICRNQPQFIYAVMVQQSGGKLKGVYRSTDTGDSWTLQANTPNFFGSQGWYDITIAVKPDDPKIVLIGGIGLYRSSDYGVTWKSVRYLHVDQHALAWDPVNTNRVLAGNDGGVYRSTNAGQSWVSRNGNLPITQYYAFDVDRKNASLIYGGTQDNGTHRGSGGLVNWSHVVGGDGGYANIDYLDSRYVYAEYQRGSHVRSTNGGVTFKYANNGLVGSGLWVTPVAMDPVDPRILYTATRRQLYKTVNRAQQWFVYNGNMDSTGSISTIAVAPSDRNTILIGKTTGKVWRTTNMGVSWENISTGLSKRYCKRVAVDPTNPSVYYATFSGYGQPHVYRSSNKGDTWVNISSNLPNIPVNDIEINPGYPGTLYVATDLGVFITTDTGGTWSQMFDGMPRAVVVDLHLHTATGLLRAATHGRSIYEVAVTVPVELEAFHATVEGVDVVLRWRTASETNNYGFKIERRSGKGTWTEVGFVPGSGTTSQAKTYTWREPLATLPATAKEAWYRLRQIDNDGTFEYSHAVRVEISRQSPARFALEPNYPNPFGLSSLSGSPITTLTYVIPEDGFVRLTVRDARGREIATLVNERKKSGAYVTVFDATGLPSGAYFVQLTLSGKRAFRKLSVMN